ncbi:MAG: hypothetical protein ACOC6F_00780 [bacterium]
MDWETNRKATSDERNGGPDLFNPMAWGVLLFSFWISLQTLPESTCLIVGMSWFFFGISVALWVSVFCRHLQDLVTRPALAGFFLPIVFFASLLAFVVTLIQSWGPLEGIARHVSLIAGSLWVVAYLVVLMRFVAGKLGHTVGIVLSAILMGIGVYTLVSSDLLGGVILIVLGIISILIAIFRPPIWHRFPF